MKVVNSETEQTELFGGLALLDLLLLLLIRSTEQVHQALGKEKLIPSHIPTLVHKQALLPMGTQLMPTLL